eukprot:Rhum_TRINITY_DN14713_c10_g2::Rhum_TRINITY_DN14713_c10_g2_i1::g.111493::m.111493
MRAVGERKPPSLHLTHSSWFFFSLLLLRHEAQGLPRPQALRLFGVRLVRSLHLFVHGGDDVLGVLAAAARQDVRALALEQPARDHVLEQLLVVLLRQRLVQRHLEQLPHRHRRHQERFGRRRRRRARPDKLARRRVQLRTRVGLRLRTPHLLPVGDARIPFERVALDVHRHVGVGGDGLEDAPLDHPHQVHAQGQLAEAGARVGGVVVLARGSRGSRRRCGGLPLPRRRRLFAYVLLTHRLVVHAHKPLRLRPRPHRADEHACVPAPLKGREHRKLVDDRLATLGEGVRAPALRVRHETPRPLAVEADRVEDVAAPSGAALVGLCIVRELHAHRVLVCLRQVAQHDLRPRRQVPHLLEAARVHPERRLRRRRRTRRGVPRRSRRR